MSKRERKVAFKEEVEIADKKRRTDENSGEDVKSMAVIASILSWPHPLPLYNYV